VTEVTKNISVKDKVHKKLKDYRDAEGFTSFNDVILHLLKTTNEGKNGAK